MFERFRNRRIARNVRPEKPDLRLPLRSAPDEIWKSIEAELDRPHRATAPVPRWSWAMGAVAVVALVSLGAGWFAMQRPRASYSYVRTQGTTETAGSIAEGGWLETNATSRARIEVAHIGTVEVEPNSRLRLIAAKPGEHRLALALGEISAVISAPPRLFFVDTPSTTAVDLGCAYRMKTDDQGNGLLHVTSGSVSLESDGHESLVPAGASCRTRRGRGPGTPFFEDAPQFLQQALDTFDTNRTGLDVILDKARARDTLTLWHLLAKVQGEDRTRIFDRMAALVPLPSGVTREGALGLDPAMLKHWREELAWAW